ncbi:uncharacterized protein LOC123317333 [Coccinella septempunctata]|uniref:uncharacterized protein LOC123317333 n=1 Tax=Coccinella septempunctata TaxID=41139 RepID=UPI001D06AB4E|nr:uncharacterized protein LOC123317333 [Coccinella septempunctata]
MHSSTKKIVRVLFVWFCEISDSHIVFSIKCLQNRNHFKFSNSCPRLNTLKMHIELVFVLLILGVVITATPVPNEDEPFQLQHVQTEQYHTKEHLFLQSMEWLKILFEQIMKMLQFPLRVPVNPEVENFPFTKSENSIQNN